MFQFPPYPTRCSFLPLFCHTRHDILTAYFYDRTMFRTQQNTFDEVVGELFVSRLDLLRSLTDGYPAKATDENLTSENWEYILVRHIKLPLSNEAHPI
jgi:hypothetical protein